MGFIGFDQAQDEWVAEDRVCPRYTRDVLPLSLIYSRLYGNFLDPYWEIFA